MNNDKPEILSPAGDLNTLIRAVDNGANAVYIGGKRFGARKNATNFTPDEMRAGVEYAHMSGAKVYVTVNTIIFDEEIEEAVRFIQEIYNIGVDAIIVQDMAILTLCKELFPDLKLHASTQVTIHSSGGVKFFYDAGFRRIVLSRELCESEIEKIVRENDAEIEVFVHGALCVCYSGQCLMSSVIGQRSGNRGECAQPCRLPFKFNGYLKNASKEGKYLLSLKDLCLAKEYERLKGIGVTSLKIEGRMKNSEYVSYVTDMYSNLNKGIGLTHKSYSDAEKIFSRSGFTTGYFDDAKGQHMVNINSNNDNVYKNIPEDLLERCRTLGCKKKRAVNAYITAKVGRPLKLKLITHDGYTGEYELDNNIEVAKSAPLTLDKIKASLSKMGDTFFYLDNVDADFDENAFLPVKDINLARRMCTDILNKNILENDRQTTDVDFAYKLYTNKPTSPRLRAKVMTREQFDECAKCDSIEKIFLEYEEFIKDREYYLGFKNKLVVSLPVIIRDKFSHKINLDGVDSVSVSNAGHIAFCKGKTIYGDEGLNIANSIACSFYHDAGIGSIMLSCELNLRQISHINSPAEKEVYAYGRLPLMHSENCLIRTYNGKCMCKDREFFYITDRKNKEFPVLSRKFNCTNTIYNSEPIFMADRINEFANAGVDVMRLVFTTENAKDVRKVISMYQSGKGADFEYTRGHFYRGVQK